MQQVECLPFPLEHSNAVPFLNGVPTKGAAEEIPPATPVEDISPLCVWVTGGSRPIAVKQSRHEIIDEAELSTPSTIITITWGGKMTHGPIDTKILAMFSEVWEEMHQEEMSLDENI